jgi:hypothetical protein
MQRKPRGDIQASLPVLEKLDAMLIDTLDTLVDQEFSYRSGIKGASEQDSWWRPKAIVPPGGLSSEALRKLKGQKEVVTNIYAVAMAINAQTLAEMTIPEQFWDSLPKVGLAPLTRFGGTSSIWLEDLVCLTRFCGTSSVQRGFQKALRLFRGGLGAERDDDQFLSGGNDDQFAQHCLDPKSYVFQSCLPNLSKPLGEQSVVSNQLKSDMIDLSKDQCECAVWQDGSGGGFPSSPHEDGFKNNALPDLPIP